MRIKSASFSRIGPRQTNDDRLLEPFTRDDSSFLVAIADGIGGASGGGEAASIAIEAAKRVGGKPECMDRIFAEAVSEIKRRGEERADLSRMGTTLSVASIRDGMVHIAHVGDTRIYHLRGAGIKHLTQDQTEIAELVRRGVFTEKEAKRYPRRNVLLSALTAKGDYSVYRNEAELQVLDRIILVSDGVHQKVMRGGLLNASIANDDLVAFVSEVTARVDKAEPSDNFSMMAVEIEHVV